MVNDISIERKKERKKEKKRKEKKENASVTRKQEIKPVCAKRDFRLLASFTIQRHKCDPIRNLFSRSWRARSKVVHEER